MKDDDTVKGYVLDTDTHVKFYRGYAQNGVGNYDDH